MYSIYISMYCSIGSSPNPGSSTHARRHVTYLGMEFQVPVTKQQNKLQETESLSRSYGLMT